MAEYKIGGVPLQPEDLGKVLRYLREQNPEMEIGIKGCSADYVAKVLSGKEEVDSRRAKAVHTYLSSRRGDLRNAMLAYVQSELAPSEDPTDQGAALFEKAANAIAGTYATAASASRAAEKAKTDVAALKKKVTTLEGKLYDPVTKAEVTKAVKDGVKGLAPKTYVDDAVDGLATEEFVAAGVKAARDGMASESYVDKKVANAKKGMASEKYVDEKVAEAGKVRVSKKAAASMQRANAILSDVLAKLKGK